MAEHRGGAASTPTTAPPPRARAARLRSPSPSRAGRPSCRAAGRRRGRRSRRRCSRFPASGCPRGGRRAEASTRTAASQGGSPRRWRAPRPWRYGVGNRVRGDPAVHDVPVEVLEERLDVRRSIRLVVEEVRVLVHVERDERCRVPHRERVLGVADVVEEPALVPVVRGPRPAPPRHACRTEICAPRIRRAEVTVHELGELRRTGRRPRRRGARSRPRGS